MGFNTNALHSGYLPSEHNGCLAPPIYQTSSFEFQSIEDAADLNSGKKFGHVYSRVSNPTVEILERRVAKLENGIGGVACASGHAAQFLVFNALLESGDNIITSPYLYGGTYHQFKQQLPKMGVEVRFINPYDLEHLSSSIDNNTKVIYGESIGNPELNALNIKELSAIANKHSIPLVIDNTLGCCGALCQPILHGADVVISSLTKWGGGHGNSIGGIVIDSGNFDWSSGRFSTFTENYSAYDTINFWKEYGFEGEGSKKLGLPFYKNAALLVKIRMDSLRDWGPCLSPFNAFLLLQGIETLGLRVERSNENASKIASVLNNSNDLSWVRYPGLESDRYHTQAKQYLINGFGSVITFEPRDGFESAKKIVENVSLFKHAANIGDSKSLILHPASTTHAQLTASQRLEAGVTEGLIRLSIGIEDVDDLINDLMSAIKLNA
tara:strand:- start:1183 stop:2499 length:1317 start_codon:yes stop_codon:yes gene_type:complete